MATWFTTYRNSIFSLFGHYDKETDINKDVAGKGTYERYNEVVGDDIDNNILPQIRDMFAQNHVPETLAPAYFITVENSLGIDFVVINTTAWRRRIIKYIRKLVMIKGTKRCYRLMLSWLGLTVTITESFAPHGLDSPLTFDHTVRVFDMRCHGCSYYKLALAGHGPMTPTLAAAIQAIILFNEPINARFQGYTYVNLDAGGDFDGADFDGDFFI